MRGEETLIVVDELTGGISESVNGPLIVRVVPNLNRARRWIFAVIVEDRDLKFEVPG
jgi:hypothetical protein